MKRQWRVGSVPQAFSHLTPIVAARAISAAEADAERPAAVTDECLDGVG